MQFQISQGGRVVGSFDFDQVVDGLKDGTFVDSDHYWCQGMLGWETLAHFRRTKMSTQTPLVPSRYKPIQRAAPVAAPAPAAAAGSQNLFGMAGGAMIVLSAVTPFLRIAIVSASLLQISDIRAWIFVGLGALCFLMALNRELEPLRFFAAGVAVAAVELIVFFVRRFAEFDASSAQSAGRDEFGDAMAKALRASVGPDVGAVMLFLGVILVLYAAFSESPRR